MESSEKNKGYLYSNKFPKAERLKSKKITEELFTKGSSSYLHPFRLLYLPAPDSSELKFPQVLISVSKRRFKRAVDRNRIKRQIKEIYRLNKSILSQTDSKRIEYLGIVYTSSEKLAFDILKKKLILALQRLGNTHQNPSV